MESQATSKTAPRQPEPEPAAAAARGAQQPRRPRWAAAPTAWTRCPTAASARSTRRTWWAHAHGGRMGAACMGAAGTAGARPAGLPPLSAGGGAPACAPPRAPPPRPRPSGRARGRPAAQRPHGRPHARGAARPRSVHDRRAQAGARGRGAGARRRRRAPRMRMRTPRMRMRTHRMRPMRPCCGAARTRRRGCPRTAAASWRRCSGPLTARARGGSACARCRRLPTATAARR